MRTLANMVLALAFVATLAGCAEDPVTAAKALFNPYGVYDNGKTVVQDSASYQKPAP